MNFGINGKGALALLPLLFAMVACNSADFGSSSGSPKRNKSSLTGKDGRDANDSGDNDGSDDLGGKGRDVDGSDSGNSDEADSGGSDSSDGSDSGGSDEADSGSTDESDTGATDTDGKDDLDDDDDEVTAANTAPLTVVRTRKDQNFTFKVELLVKDVVKKTQDAIVPPGKGASITVDGMCRKGSKKTTQLRITINNNYSTNGIVEGAATNTSTCIYATRLTENQMQLDFDPGGFGGSGSNCGKGEDDILTFSCPDSKKLELK